MASLVPTPTVGPRRRRGLATLTSLALALAPLAPLVGGCANEEEARTAPGAPAEVLVVETKAEDVPIYAEFIGTLDGNINTELRVRVPGYITSVDYKEGAAVKAGQVLFTIDPVLAQANVTRAAGDMALAKASLAKAEADVERLKPLVASNAVSRQTFDNAVAAQAMAKAQILGAQGALETARANLGFTKVTAPIDGIAGIAGIAKVRVGSLVGQTEATLLTTVSQLDPIRLRFTISEQLYLRFAVDLRRIVADATSEGKLEMILADGKVYPQRGKIALIDRQVDPSTGSISLDALFPNSEQLLRPGQYAKIRGVTEVNNGVVVVPQRAVRELQGLTQVVVVGEGDKAELRTVVMGARVGSHWVVESGVKPGERLVVEGPQKVRPGAVVAPRVVPMPPRNTVPEASSASPAAPSVPPSASASSAPKGG